MMRAFRLDAKAQRRRATQPCGFTLVEMAIVLVIIGLLIGGGIGIQQSALKKQNLQLTHTKMQEILKAIDNFVDYYGYLPCPSNPEAAFSDDDFGVGKNYALHKTTGVVVLPTDVNSGSNDCTHNNAHVILGTTGGDLYEGGLPVLTLGLPPGYALDGWGARFVYVVDSNMTFRGDGLKPDAGTIGYTKGDNDGISNQLDLQGRIILNTPDNTVTLRNDIAVLVLSAGDNGFGTWPGRGGARVPAVYGSPVEQRNADDNDIFNQPLAADDSDDVVYYLTKWQMDAARSF